MTTKPTTTLTGVVIAKDVLSQNWRLKPEDMGTVLAATFGELVKLTDGVTVHHRGDLFHDAEWMRKHITAERVESDQGQAPGYLFYFGVRNTGTSIGEDKDLVWYSNELLYAVNLWQSPKGNVQLIIAGHRWEVTK